LLNARPELVNVKRSSRAAASIVAGLVAVGVILAAARGASAAEPVAERSIRLLPLSIQFDGRTADAVSAKSLPELIALYAELGAHAAATEAARNVGQEACGCDVALANLRIVVGFAINKLDGQGRYQSWMRAESMRLRDQFANFMADCADDAGVPLSPVRLQTKHLKGL
jgi:hypothetical protein